MARSMVCGRGGDPDQQESERERGREAMRVGGSIGPMGRDERTHPGGVQLASISTRIDVRIAGLLQLGEGGQRHQRKRGGGGGDGGAAGVEAVDAQGVAGRDDEGSDERLVQHFSALRGAADLGAACRIRDRSGHEIDQDQLHARRT